MIPRKLIWLGSLEADSPTRRFLRIYLRVMHTRANVNTNITANFQQQSSEMHEIAWYVYSAQQSANKTGNEDQFKSMRMKQL